MLYIGAADIPGSDDHEGYVAGLSPDGSYTDIWTDVRHAGTPDLLAYAPACECGWHGRTHPSDPGGYRAAAQDWLTEHFAVLDPARPVLAGLGRPLCPDTDFLTAPDPARHRTLA
ncbi:MAG: hypothetical protein ABW212_19475 [Pseudonocardia sediminis]